MPIGKPVLGSGVAARDVIEMQIASVQRRINSYTGLLAIARQQMQGLLLQRRLLDPAYAETARDYLAKIERRTTQRYARPPRRLRMPTAIE